jgi:long-chain acyl-CoA synthetase
LSHITARALDYVMYNCMGRRWLIARSSTSCPGDARGEADGDCGSAAGVRKDSAGSGAEVGGVAGEEAHAGLGGSAGREAPDTVYSGGKPSSALWKLASKLVYSKVQEAFGGRVRIFVSGGAPLGIDTARWFASVGIALWEGYGLTETSPVIAINSPVSQRMGTVGQKLANVELKFAEDGELLVRGPSVFAGYWQKPAADAECFDAEGWFRTGDIAALDADGFLSITDRKKELLKTSGGKLVAPQPIENKLKNNVLVAQAALVGDKHKFICALVSPNFASLEAWARSTGSREKLAPHWWPMTRDFLFMARLCAR